MHVDVELITACALGELSEPERHEVMKHCQACRQCGDLLAASMLLAGAANEVAHGSDVEPVRSRRSAWVAAAGLVLATGLVVVVTGLFLDGGDELPSAVRESADAPEPWPTLDLTHDAGIRQASVLSGRNWANMFSGPATAEATAEVLHALDLFEQEDYLGAAAVLATTPNLGASAVVLLGQSLFYGGEDAAAEATFEELANPHLNTPEAEYWDSFSNASAYYLARLYFRSNRSDEARRLTRVVVEARDRWAVPGDVLVDDHLSFVFVPGTGPLETRETELVDEGLRALVLAWGRFLFPEDVPDRGWIWMTGVPTALDAFEHGDFLEAAAELAANSSPDEYRSAGFDEVLLGISLFYAAEHEDAQRAFEEYLRYVMDYEKRPVTWGFLRDASCYYLARLYLSQGRTEDAAKLAALVLDGRPEWAAATRLLLDEG